MLMTPLSALKINRSMHRLLRSPLFDVFQLFVLFLISIWLINMGARQVSYHWQWYRIPQFFLVHDGQDLAAGPLLQGLLITLQISAISLVVSLAIGLVTAAFRLSASPVANLLARIYIEAIRNTPLLIQLFFIYFVLGPLLGLDRLPAAILSLSLFEGAYIAEILRSGILSVAREQHEAAYSLGLGPFYTYRLVILPQAIRTVLPPLTSQAISLIKDSALVSTIAIYDLTMQAQAIIAETFLTFEVWLTVAALYLCITVVLSSVAGTLEHRLKLP